MNFTPIEMRYTTRFIMYEIYGRVFCMINLMVCNTLVGVKFGSVLINSGLCDISKFVVVNVDPTC